jgi:RHH-type proline utilization regulon transcriptional repressor/proline dehydrogenase/delta 1-pyrroline-5-carboxylate dehydrogenase
MTRSLLFAAELPRPTPLRAAVGAAHLVDESTWLRHLAEMAALDGGAQWRIEGVAKRLVAAIREHQGGAGGLEAFLHEYDLSSQEGVMLMCLAEALLRIPDAETADRLIQDKLCRGKWDAHLGHSRSLLVNASTWGLILSGRLLGPHPPATHNLAALLERMVARSGEAVLRLALKQAMALLAGHFVMGATIEEALQHRQREENRDYRFSFDMLGEAALSTADAERYFQAYLHAIRTIAATAAGDRDTPGVSVKLSALHPRCEYAQRERVLAELVPRLGLLADEAAAAGIGLTVDAEEADRLELTLEVFEAVFLADRKREGFGLAVQAYQKRALPVLDWLADLARAGGRRIPVRLVKGAYWDTEIKRAQIQGLEGYPVFTRKAATDVSYLACVRRMFANLDAFYPQFATHNAHTVAYILEAAGGSHDFEFQRLYGMGNALYREIVGPDKPNPPCRVYAPVGHHRELLPYLVRRLLENGSNSAFVNRLADERLSPAELVADPVAEVRGRNYAPHPRIPLPTRLYGEARRNSAGLSFGEPAALAALDRDMEDALARAWDAAPLVGGKPLAGRARPVSDPADRRRIVGAVTEADDWAVEEALAIAAEGAPAWNGLAAEARAERLERAAELLEEHRAALMALCVREGGKTVPDALAEVREAADYCRYYAHLARRDFARPLKLPGPAGETNELYLAGRGVFACISPWNFPLAIFTGQVAAALAAGNGVIAKPAGQTPLTAMLATRLLLEAGIPGEALQLLPGEGRKVGMKLIADPRIHGVAFTGSTETAQMINRALAAREGPIPPLIAETGGQNAMIVDSSALPEQVVADVIQSAFNSAGQRCSALRVLFLQEEIAPRILDLMMGALGELRIGDPARLATDIGPVIDEAAREALAQHAERMGREGRLLYKAALPPETDHGSFFAPQVFEIDRLDLLHREVFGPILHVIRYPADAIDQVIDAINATGYGLTLGMHSRIDESVEHLRKRARVGNLYVNRNMIGAVVGVQPFGGEGLSGTGPKAGGPHYLHRFAVERTFTVNTMAVGGNASLLAEWDGE